MGIIFQAFRLIPSMTVYENMCLCHACDQQRAPQGIRPRVEYILELVHLEDKAKCYPDTLSGGEQQRVAVARALVHNPKLVIADEPTGNIDPELSLEMMQLLERVSKMGITVLVVTHEHELVHRFHQRVVTLSHGRIISDVPADPVARRRGRSFAGCCRLWMTDDAYRREKGKGGCRMMRPLPSSFLTRRGVRNLGKHWAMTIACIASLERLHDPEHLCQLGRGECGQHGGYLGSQNETVVYLDPACDDATAAQVGAKTLFGHAGGQRGAVRFQAGCARTPTAAICRTIPPCGTSSRATTPLRQTTGSP